MGAAVGCSVTPPEFSPSDGDSSDGDSDDSPGELL